MDDDYREPVRRLFVAAAEITETAHEAAIAGQSEALTARAYAEAAPRLEAAAVIANPDDGDPSGRADRTPLKIWTSRRPLRAAQEPLRRSYSAISPLGAPSPPPSLTRYRPCTAPAGA